MRKTARRLRIENKPLSAAVKIVAVLIADILILHIVPREFWQINTKDFIQKWYDNEAISPAQWLSVFWNSNNYELAANIILVVIIIMLRFRFKKAENFRLSRRTMIIALLCVIASAIGILYILRYGSSGASWQWRASQMLRTLIIVALFEELIYRGFITNELFRLKPYGLKTPAAIAISAAIFGFIHIQGSVARVLNGSPPSFTWYTAERFGQTAAVGVSMAVILYYTKDIISLICIHATNNILYDSYLAGSYAAGGEVTSAGVLFAVFSILFYICYPVFLIYKGKTRQGGRFKNSRG